ncbi:MAG: hypothetical protein IIB77_02335, partial [Proteobacteria bacterium]|nr:hypothetical protein [Pseudomonadota bacterium]
INDLTAAVVWTNVPNANITQASVTQHQAAISHDALSGFVANEHLDWTADLGATNLHSGNSANSVLALTSGEVTQLANIGATVISAADWTATAALVGTNTGDEAAASLTVQGIVELATIAETNTGTDAGRAVTPDGLDGWTGNSALVTSSNAALALTSGEVTQLANINATVVSTSDWTAVAALVGTNTGDQTITLTGNVTGSGTGSFAATIANDAVTLAKMANMATASFIGRTTAATGDPEVLSATTARSILNVENGAAADQTITLTGNVTGAGTGSFVATIANNAVSLAKMADIATDSFIGRDTAATGDPEVLSATTARSILNVENNSTADQTAGEIEAIVDHDLLVGFVGSEHVNHAAVAVTAGTGLSGGGTIETTRTINADIASETQQGISERATQAEVNAGTDTGRHITVSTLTNSALTTVNASAAEIGYKGSPLNTQNGDYTLVLGDAAKTIFKASGGAGETITIPANASVAFPIGTIIVVLNGGGGTLLLAITTDTLTQAGTGDTGTRTLADDAMVSIIKVTATAWYLSGTGAT